MKHAFSLVELSIVLVILGLLTGGILAGQNLIRAAELRSVVTDYQRYYTAVQTFKGKYFALPGDMPNATAFWGQVGDSGGGNTCPLQEGTGTETCNGDGDGILGTAGVCTGARERHRFWEHLNNAGMVEGNYTGVAGSGGCNHVLIGVNAPASKIGNQSGFSAFNEYFMFGKQSTGDSLNSADALSPEEQWNIDTKIDDGLPTTGHMFTSEAEAVPGCWDDDSGSPKYQVGTASIECHFQVHLSRK